MSLGVVAQKLQWLLHLCVTSEVSTVDLSCTRMAPNSTYYLLFSLFTFNFSLFTSHAYPWLFCTYFTTYFDRMTLAFYIFTYRLLMLLILTFFCFFLLFLTFFGKVSN